MKVTKKHTDGDAITLDVTVSSAEVGDALNQASVLFAQQMGLQPVADKTPAQVAQEKLGIKNLDEVVTQGAIEALIPQAINKSGIMPAFPPTPEPQSKLARGQAFKFTMDVLPKPEYELQSYEPVAFSVPVYEPDEKAIDAQISELARRNLEFVAVEPHPLTADDACFIKMSATKGGVEVTGLNTEGRSYQLGQQLMPEGFDENLIGMEVGETRTFKFMGPEYDENFEPIMEEFEATVTLLEVQEERIPVIDDEWVRKYMPLFKSVEDMRAMFGKQIDAQRQMQYEMMKRNAAAGALAKRFEGSIPDEIYEGTMREMVQRLYQQVAQSGQKWEDFLAQNGGEQQLNMLMMVQTRDTLVTGYALDAYYRHKGLVFTDEDINQVCAELNPQYPKQVRENMEKSGYGFSLRESAERLRACKDLVEHADITYVDPNAPVEEVVEEAVEEVVEEPVEETTEE